MKLTKSSRAFRRATAFVLAAAMTLSAPVATQASAASKKKVPSLSVKKKTLYYNQAGKKSFTLKVKKNKVKKIVKTKWTTSKKSIVGISAKKKTKVKVTAKKKGTAKITAKVTYRLKAGSKAKTKKLVCKVTSKKKSSVVTPVPATETPATSGTPATDVPATDVPATDVPATDAPTEAPTEAPTDTPAPTETPAAVVANVDKVSAIDPSDFAVTLTFTNPAGEVTEDLIKNAKLTFVKGSISVTASYQKIDEQGSAVFKIDDSKALRPGNRSADGDYTVTSSSANLVLPKDASTTYEEALAGMAVEGYVTTWNSTSTAVNKYEAVKGAVVSIKGGKSATTDAEGYYRIATTAGKKTLSVEAEAVNAGADYINQTTGTGAVSINRNHPTAQNFVLAKYNVNEVYLKIKAVDSKDETISVTGAAVKLKDAAGNVVAGTNTLKTDGSGKAIFANNAVADATITAWTGTADAKQKANTNPAQVFLQRNTTYTVELEKKLAKTNLTDVYKLATAEVKIGGQYDNEVVVRMVKVAKLPSMTITQTYAASTTEGTAAAALPNATTAPVCNTYQLFTDLDGNKVADELMNAPATALETGINNSRVTASELIANIPALNNATLPTGKYYVLIKGYTATDAATPTTTAYAVVEVDVTEGAAAKAAVTRTIGCTRELTTNIGLTEVNAKPQETTVPGVSSGSALKNIVKNGNSYDLGVNAVNANNKLYQVMTDDVLVQVEASGELPVQYTDKKTYSAKNEYTHILGSAKYCIKTDSNYSKAADWTFAANDIINAQHTIDSESKWNLVAVTVKAQTGDALVGNKAPQLTKIRVLDGNGAEKYVKDFTATPVSATSAATLGNNDPVTYNINDAALKLMDGGDYKIEVTLKNCLPVTSAVTKTVGLEDLTAAITEKVMPATSSDLTTVAGTVSINMNNGKVEKANASTRLVQIVALSGNKIAGFATTNASGKYEIKDTVNGTKLGAGTYTLVARSGMAETTIATVTLTDKQNLAQDIVMNEGANGSIKAVITNTNKNAISGARFTAYDAYYVNSSVAANWVGNAIPVSTPNSTLLGEFADQTVLIHGNTNYPSTTEREALGLSAGTYTLKFSEPNNQYDMTRTETVTLQDVGQKVYPEYQFNPKGEQTGSGKVDLTVKHPDFSGAGAMYVVVVKREDGTTEAIKYLGDQHYPSAAEGSKTNTVLQVTSHQTYEVKVYNTTGNYVGSNKAVVQGVASDVTVAFDTATVD